MTKMQSELMAEVTRCVTTNCVQPEIFSFSAERSFRSVRISCL